MSANHRILRDTLRRKRRSLPAPLAAASARLLAQHVSHHPLLHNRQHIAAYIANDGEIDPHPLLQQLWAQGKTVYLPVLMPFVRGKLWFARYCPGDALVPNRFGIPEPQRLHLVAPRYLDLVLTPLVAFDDSGHRIGMGGGYYDRSFAFLRTRQHWRKPVLLGLAYEFQRQRAIAPDRWNVPLDAIATEQDCYPLPR
jgi:5-formyltetrahydrofolate cyclo-ligase